MVMVLDSPAAENFSDAADIETTPSVLFLAQFTLSRQNRANVTSFVIDRIMSVISFSQIYINRRFYKSTKIVIYTLFSPMTKIIQ